jgi:HlyD family secretion protein
VIRALFVLAVLGALAAAWRVPKRAASVEEATFSVKVADQVLTLTARGQIEAAEEQAVTVQNIHGQIEEIVEEGSLVKKGQVVCRISTFQYDEQERKARLDVMRKEAEKKKTERENASTAAEEKKKIAEKLAELEHNKRVLAYLEGGPDPRVVEALALRIQKAEMENASLARRKAAQEALKTRGFLSELDYESIATDLEKAKLERGKQENLLADRREGPREQERERSRLAVDKFALDVELAKKTLASQDALRTLALAKKDAEIKDRQAAVDEKRRMKTYAVIRAPRDGTVVYGQGAMQGEPIGLGAGVYRGLTLMEIVQIGAMKAVVTLPERWMDRVQVGQAVELTAAHRLKVYTGTVQKVSRLAVAADDDPKGVRLFTVEVKLDAAAAELKPSMSCEARIRVTQHRAAAKVPVDLARERGAGTARFTVRMRSGRHETVEAKVLDEDFDHLYVTGLAAGAELVY